MTIGPRKVDRPLVLYGYGRLGKLAEEIFRELKIPIAGFIDNRVPTKPFDALLAICVASDPYAQVTAPLIAAGWVDIAPIWEIIAAYPEIGIGNGWTIDRMDNTDNDMVASVYDRLHDEHSQCNYMDFLLWRRDHFEDVEGNWYPPEPQEPLPSTLADIRQRQRVSMVSDGPMISVSIHAEGCELKTLEENMHLFQKYRPSIKVSVYHSRDGLYLIEKFLMDNLPDYQWTFRLTAYMGQGAYIYGVPQERSEK
jgi:hypothetical protein